MIVNNRCFKLHDVLEELKSYIKSCYYDCAKSYASSNPISKSGNLWATACSVCPVRKDFHTTSNSSSKTKKTKLLDLHATLVSCPDGAKEDLHCDGSG